MKMINISEQMYLGNSLKESFTSIKEIRLVILVGVTGVGKSTLAELLLEDNSFYFLPGRRKLTDEIIIPEIQQRNDKQKEKLNRLERFNYSKAYKKIYPGGMAYLLSQVKLSHNLAKKILLFDGLRGQKELEFAARKLPKALFINLTAPDSIRVRRLLKREDSFDNLTEQEETRLDYSKLDLIFAQQEKKELLKELSQKIISKKDLAEKIEIILRERENYKPELSKKVLSSLAPTRTKNLATNNLTAQELSTKALKFIRGHL